MPSVRKLLAWAAVAGVVAMTVPVAGAQCLITGPTTMCPGDTIQLCADGDAWTWAGPNGFNASTQCVSATQPGQYSVSVFDSGFGIWIGPCTVLVPQLPPESCATSQPPPDPPPTPGTSDSTNCPRPASFWERQLRHGSRRDGFFDPATMATLAACMDAHSSALDWSDPVAGMRDVLGHEGVHGLRSGAMRQFAAVMANLCARDELLATPDGTRIGLDPEATFTLMGHTGTVGAWAQAADAQLAALHNASSRDGNARLMYRQIFTYGWALSHGLGMTMSCSVARRFPDSEDHTLAAALRPTGGMIEDGEPDVTGSAHASITPFVITDPNGADVDVAAYDVAGRRVASIASGHLAAGTYPLAWSGHGVRAGVYFIRARIGATAITRTVLISH